MPYIQLIELYRRYGLELNSYNISCHISRHVKQRDIEEVDRLQARYAEQGLV